MQKQLFIGIDRPKYMKYTELYRTPNKAECAFVQTVSISDCVLCTLLLFIIS